MKAATHRSSISSRRHSAALFLAFLLLAYPATAATNNQLVLSHADRSEHPGEYKGIVDLAIVPGVENARVAVEVDGQKIADGLLSPWHLLVDFGPSPVQHRITITAAGSKGKAVRWTETVNRGKLSLSLTVKLVDLATRTFEVQTTASPEDPVASVQLWADGALVATVSEPPYRFQAPESAMAEGIVQVSVRTKAGEEAADFWSAGGSIHVEEMQVRTVPIFVSVIDRHGQTLDDVDRAQFRILDNETEVKIVEFGKAFDQPISIALLIDASASMNASMKQASKAARDFVELALKDGDRCSITAIHDVPRRRQALTGDRAAIANALHGIEPEGRTALHDGIASAIREIRDEKNRRAIVVMTDGADTSSTYEWDEVQSMAREAAIPIYFIAYEGAADETGALDRLRFLSAETGGFVATATQQNLAARYEAIERDLRAQFAIRYQIADFGKANQYRRVRVVLDSPKLTARTIKGYFTP